jgi:tetratricopeptide (TPR) repeat protein
MNLLLTAQEKSANDYKLEAAEAYKANDFAKALTGFEKAIELYNQQEKIDTTLYYNAALSAFKLSQWDKAVSYFDHSIRLDYRTCNAYLYKGNALKKAEKFDQMEATLNEARGKCPDMKDKYNDILFNYYLKNGLDFYNKGSKIQSSANGLAKTDQNKYQAEIDKAKTEYRKALPHLEKAYSINPIDKNVTTALKASYEILEMKDQAARLK